MIVTYTPPLMEQIQANRKPERVDVRIVRTDGSYVSCVDPVTRTATGEAKLFTMADYESMK